MQTIRNEFAQYLAVERAYSDHTCAAYGRDLDQYLDFLDFDGNVTSLDVDRQTIRRFLALVRRDAFVIREKRRPISERTIARKLSALRCFYRFLKLRGLLTTDPAALVQIPKTAKTLPVFAEEGWVHRMMALPDTKNPAGLRDKTILELLYGTGLRLSELRNLKRDDLNLPDGLFRIFGKGGKERVVPLQGEAERWLKRWLAADASGEDEFIFPGRRSGRPLGSRTIQRVVERYLKQVATLSRMSPHVLRHSFATHLLARGADLRSIQEMLGHASLTSTQIYTHVTTEKLKAVHRKAHPRG
ncbi:MAG: tyrosine recombinase XerC [bacterium]|nr:tyrosine recombinase XerC [bacterium]